VVGSKTKFKIREWNRGGSHSSLLFNLLR
jgi:hypothetical protein